MGPFFYFANPPRFPVQLGRPVLVSREQFEDCCCHQAFDFAVIRYSWDAMGGTDLDTRTALVEVEASVDGLDVGFGWNRHGAISGASGDYLVWGGDNTDPEGSEAVLIDFAKIAADFPALSEIKVRLRANWFGLRNSGDFILQFETWAAGVMTPIGTDFQNTGGTSVETLTLPRNVLSNVSGDVDGDDCGTLIFTTRSRTANIT